MSKAMRISLETKTFDYFQRIDLSGDSEQTLIEKLKTSGPMTKQCVVAELARRNGGQVVRKRSE